MLELTTKAYGSVVVEHHHLVGGEKFFPAIRLGAPTVTGPNSISIASSRLRPSSSCTGDRDRPSHQSTIGDVSPCRLMSSPSSFGGVHLTSAGTSRRRDGPAARRARTWPRLADFGVEAKNGAFHCLRSSGLRDRSPPIPDPRLLGRPPLTRPRRHRHELGSQPRACPGRRERRLERGENGAGINAELHAAVIRGGMDRFVAADQLTRSLDAAEPRRTFRAHDASPSHSAQRTTWKGNVEQSGLPLSS